MTVYIDYTFYTTTYGGTVITAAEFPSLAAKASAFIDFITMDRVAPYFEIVGPSDEEEAIIERIKLATCAVMDTQKALDSAGGLVASESVGSHSVSYVTEKSQSPLTKKSDAAKMYLAQTGLMYRGFYAGEYGSDTVLT